jgi:hypothetical protein
MRTKVGLWIDHKKAIVVAGTDKEEETGLIISKVEKQLRRSGDSPLKGPHESQQVPADDSRQRTFTDISTFTMMRSLRLFVRQRMN